MEKTGTPGVISCANAALTLPLVADPGEKWEYGIGIDWVGKAVEAVTGQKLGQIMNLETAVGRPNLHVSY